jgi:outer membrane protein assembly factor BamB
MAEANTMAKSREAIYVGIRGTVLLAATKSELFCLDSATGKILWNNEWKGLGRGLMTVATANSPFGSVVPNVAKKRRDDEAAASAAAAASS